VIFLVRSLDERCIGFFLPLFFWEIAIFGQQVPIVCMSDVGTKNEGGGQEGTGKSLSLHKGAVPQVPSDGSDYIADEC
jgi:hypothetical protein